MTIPIGLAFLHELTVRYGIHYFQAIMSKINWLVTRHGPFVTFVIIVYAIAG